MPRLAVPADGTFLFDTNRDTDAVAAAQGRAAAPDSVHAMLADGPAGQVRFAALVTDDVRKVLLAEGTMQDVAGARTIRAAVRIDEACSIDLRCTFDGADGTALARAITSFGALLCDAWTVDASVSPARGHGSIPIDDLVACLRAFGVPEAGPDDPGLHAEGAPALEGAGTLARVLLSGSWQSVDVFVVAPGERHVLAQARGWFLLDDAYHVVARPAVASSALPIFSADGRKTYWLDADGFSERPLPAFEAAAELTIPERLFQPALCPLPDGFLITGSQVLHRVRTAPLRRDGDGTLAVPGAANCSVDPRTGVAVLLGTTQVELIDVDALRSLAVLDLPRAASADQLAAAEGRAWIGTKLGLVMVVDVAAREVKGGITLADAGETMVARSVSGRTMVLACRTRNGAGEWPIVLRVFRVGADGVEQIASARFTSPERPGSIAVLESSATVLLAGRRPLAWCYTARAR
jgi:hypothetical protein